MNLSLKIRELTQKVRANPRISSSLSYIRSDRKHLIIVLALVLAIPLTVVAALTQQETRQRASGIILSRIEVSPGEITAKVNGPNVAMSALAYDDSNNPVFSGVSYEWSMSSTKSVATLTRILGDITQLDPLSVGYGEITVVARLGSQSITKGVAVRITNPDGSIPPPPPVVRITYPNGGETFTQGEKVKITWEGRNIDSCYIDYSYGVGSLSNITKLSTTGNGSYDWTVNLPNLFSPKQIKISMDCYQTGAGSKRDQSDDFFTVNPLPKPTPTPTPTPIPVPGQPKNLKVLKVADTTEPAVKYVQIGWDPVADATSYNAYSAEHNSSPIQYVFNGNVTTASITLKFNKSLTYSFQVEALGSGGVGPKSEPLVVSPAPQQIINLTPVADTYAVSNNIDKNFGTSDQLQVDGQPNKLSYLKFDLTPYKEKNVVSVKLRLRSMKEFKGVNTIRNVPNSSWGETTLTHRNRPANDTAIIAGFDTGKPGTDLEVDLTNYIKSKLGGIVSFNIRTNADINAYFASRNSKNSPQLILTIQP